MASIIAGYEYDIFISYRQKDNRYDGWITEFVDNLKKELEATFKEDVSIYFDENPHDGLLEIHNVDKSLETKLKSLVFIPVISQTYCDPNSFAWQNEFITFKEMASQDPFGRDVKLSSGNVCSRIIPVIAYTRAGQKDKALELVKEMEKNMDSWWSAWGVAEIYSAIGEKDKAIDALEVVYKLRADYTPFIQAFWIFKPLFDDPRFKGIVSRFNFPK